MCRTFRALVVGGCLLAVVGGTAGCGGGVDDSRNGTASAGGATSSAGDGQNSSAGAGTTDNTGSNSTNGTTDGTDSGAGSGETGGTDTDGATTTDGGSTDASSGGGRTVIGNLIASPDNAECVYQPGGAVGGANAIQVFFYILLIGANPDQLPGLVHVVVRSDTGLVTDYRSAVNNQAQSVAALPVRAGDFGRTHSVTLTVDTGDEVAESDESDNQIRAIITVPSAPVGTTTLQCSISRA